MADAVRSIVIANTPELYVVSLTCLSDGTGETNVVKVDKSTLTGPTSAEPGSLDLIQIDAWQQGFTYIKLSWDHTTDDTMLLIPPGVMRRNFEIDVPNSFRQTGRPVLADPRSAGDTGDVLLSSVGPTAGDTYDITLWFKKSA